jgi:ribose 5-phosphate isomerase B
LIKFVDKFNAMKSVRIAIGCDHAGYDLKESIKEFLIKNNFVVKDFGAFSTDAVDYPDYVHPLSNSIEKGENDMGVLICGSANGVAITANKHIKIRAAIAWNNEVASLARKHNNANVLCLPARFISRNDAIQFVNTFFTTDFEGGRHAQRVNKISVF